MEKIVRILKLSFIMKIILFFLPIILFSCDQSDKDAVDASLIDTTVQKTVQPKAAQPEDSATARIHRAVDTIVTAELKFTSQILSMATDSVRYEMVSLRDYYQVQRDELSRDAHLSTNKEKTNNALAYLDGMIKKAPVKPEVYKVQFHLNAQLANNIVYNEGHTKYLRKDLTEIRIVFP